MSKCNNVLGILLTGQGESEPLHPGSLVIAGAGVGTLFFLMKIGKINASVLNKSFFGVSCKKWAIIFVTVGTINGVMEGIINKSRDTLKRSAAEHFKSFLSTSVTTMITFGVVFGGLGYFFPSVTSAVTLAAASHAAASGFTNASIEIFS